MLTFIILSWPHCAVFVGVDAHFKQQLL